MTARFKVSSLRLFLMVASMILSASLILGYSTLSANFFVEGMDTVLRGSMRDLGRAYADRHIEPAASPARVASYILARRWEDIPADIRQQFPEATAATDHFLKKVEGSVFTLPRSAHFILPVTSRHTGVTVFVAKRFIGGDFGSIRLTNPPPPIRKLLFLIAVSTLAIVLILLGIWFVLRAVSTPLERLANWARDLGSSDLAQPAPDFRYRELNEIARLVQSSVAAVQDTMEREKMFLGYASHELRTPIAVMRNNLELLRRLHQELEGRDLQVVERLERAVHTMGDLTNTLLWLSRQSDSLPAENTPYSLREMLQELVEELQYLLSGKNIRLELQLEEYTCVVPRVPLRIILGNLIRNAFQHTQEGMVLVQLRAGEVCIFNDDPKDEMGSSSHSDLGFGLGLLLVERLTERLGFAYSLQRRQHQQKARIDISHWQPGPS